MDSHRNQPQRFHHLRAHERVACPCVNQHGNVLVINLTLEKHESRTRVSTLDSQTRLSYKTTFQQQLQLSLGVDALTTLGQSFFMWPFSPHPKHASLSLGGYGPPMPSAFSFFAHCWDWAQTSRAHVCLFCASCLLPRVVVLAHLGRSYLVARLLLVRRVIPQPFRHPHEVLYIIRQLRHSKYQLTRLRLQLVDKLQLFIVIRHMLEGTHNPLQLPNISFDRMCLPQIQPRHSRRNVRVLWDEPACDKSLEFRLRHLTFHNLLILDIFHPPSQCIPA